MGLIQILSMVGGLALFLYGMDLMGNSLTSYSGSQLSTILSKLTSNPYKAVFLGAIVTAIIQSSTGTTVMVVGLVNSGIMVLRQAIGVIMGANIGTTITAWILSLTGIQSSNIFLQLLKPTNFAPILAIIGVVFILFIKDDKKRNLAGIFVGFAILIFGMDAMASAMTPLADSPAFQELFVHFSNPIIGILVGAVLTAVIQSSTGSIGILQALSATGMVTMSAAFPIIMGQNIGTCITAALSAIGAQRSAKRAAMVHLIFNFIGTLLFTLVVYGGGLFIDMKFLELQATPVSIALMHSIFNIVNTLIMVNFIPLLERLAYVFIPENEEERQLKYDPIQTLDDRLLDTPSIALQQCETLSVAMFDFARTLFDGGTAILTDFDGDAFKKMKKLESKVDRYEDALGSYLLKLSAIKLTEHENNELTTMLHAIGDFERIADHGYSMVMAAKELHDKEITFSDYASAELSVYLTAVNDVLALTRSAYAERAIDKARLVEPLEEVIDVLNSQLKLRHVQRLKIGLCSIDLGFIWADVLNALERISDHCSNVAVLILELEDKNLSAHEYLNKIKKKSNAAFQNQVSTFLAAYPLPEPAQSYPWPEVIGVSEVPKHAEPGTSHAT